jgi:Transglutaminase-like superfamily
VVLRRALTAECLHGIVTIMGEFLRVLIRMPLIEWRRRTLSLHHAVALARASHRGRRLRTRVGRVRLQQAIAFVDARMPGGPNCVRRSLMEITLDADAAGEPLYAGIKRGGGPRSGHAWLESHSVHESYDAIVSVQ